MDGDYNPVIQVKLERRELFLELKTILDTDDIISLAIGVFRWIRKVKKHYEKYPTSYESV